MNIMLSGVGGQGLVMTTDMICEVASQSGYDVKSNDVVGLSQRGGKVWGSVKYGDVIHSPNIGEGEADVLLALEPLEGLRWQHYLRPGGVLVMNTSPIYPVFAIAEKAPYPHDFLDIGTSKIVNVIMLGALSRQLDLEQDLWTRVITHRVPIKFLDMNIEGFKRGFEAAR